MAHILTNYGEEYAVLNGLDSDTAEWTVGLYNDTTDDPGDTDDVTDLTTEPSGAAYARQTSTFSPSNEDGDVVGLVDASINDSDLVYDTSDTTETVDSWFVTITWTATGDGSDTEHLVATGALSQERPLDGVDEFTVSAGGVGVSFD